MKLRYYMRGLGIGILVTAILMGVTLEGKTEKLTDAEIIKRAEALGMEQKYESTVLADTVSENETEEEKETGDETRTEEVLTETQTEAEEEPEMAKPQEIETDVTDEMQEIETDVKEEEQEVAETVQITVQGGDGSQTVARKLAEAGLIEDVLAYDKYLCRNGYDKRICTGTHTIPLGAGDEEIAKIITSRP